MKFSLWAWSKRLQQHVPSAHGDYPIGPPEELAQFMELWRKITREIDGDSAADELEGRISPDQ